MNEEISRIDINNVSYNLKDEETRTLSEMGKQALIKIGYYECSSEASSASKTIAASNYVLGNGGSIKVKMTNANSAANATLNINSTGTKPLYYNGERASANNSWETGETVEIYYDGTSYYANNVAGSIGYGDGVFDVSVKYPTSGVDGGNTYTLAGALAVLNTNLSSNKKRGGMSIKFVQSSDNKYVQYRLMATSFSTTVADWQGVDDKPIAGSENLVKSGGVEKRLYNIDGLSTYVDKKEINAKGVISDNNSFFISIKIPIKSGDTIFWKYSNSAVKTSFCIFDQNDNLLEYWDGNNGSNGERTFITDVAASYAIASFDRNSDYTPLVKVNGETVWTKKEKGAIELINEKIVTDNFPSLGSNNLVKSNGIFIDFLYTKVNIDSVDIKEAINKHNGYVDNLGTVLSYTSNWFYSDPILLKAGYMIISKFLTRSDVSTLSIAQGDSVNVGDILTPLNSNKYKATEDVYIVISGMTSELNKPIYIKKGNVRTPIALIGQIDKDFYGIGNTVRNKYIGYDGTIHDDNDWNIISREVNQNDSVTWVIGALRGNASLVIYDINDNVLDYWNVNGAPNNKDSRDIEFSNYPNAHHIVASFSKFLLNGDENTVPLVINGVDVESIDRTSKGTYDTVKELNKRVSEICPEPYDEYGVIGINYSSEVKKVIEDIDKNIWGTKLHFCHVSDNHSGRFGYADEFTDLSPAKFLVNTGDLVTDKFSDSFDTPKGLILAMNKPGYVVLGNHDVYKSTSLQERFEKYFAPLNEHNGLTGNTKTYYSVDYSQEKVKCIFLDMNDGWDDTSDLIMGYFINKSKMSSEQINWFAQELINAESNNLHVACFIHVSPDYVNYEKSPIDFYDYQVEKATNVAFLCDMIDKFIEGGTVTFTHNEQEYTFSFVAGGHFVGWFCGHMHCDCSGWMLNHPKQFSVSVPRPGWNDMEEDGTYRIPKLGISFNYVTIDAKFQRLSILRIGNNKTIWGTSREGFSIRYN